MVATVERMDLLSIGAAAQRLGISASLLRRMEDQGLVPPAMRLIGSDRRVYSATQVEEIRRIREARRLARTPREAD